MRPLPDAGATRDRISQAARDHVDRIPEMFASMQTLFRTHDPVGVIATIAFYALQRRIRPDGSIAVLSHTLEQHEVELLQAIVLTVPQEEWPTAPSVPAAVQQVYDELPRLASAFLAQRIVAAKDMTKPQERTAAGILERIRFHTQAIRNWGYFGDAISISREIYGQLDASLLAFHGFTASDVIALAQGMVLDVERRASAWLKALATVAGGKTIPDILSRYLQAFPGMLGTPESLEQAFAPGTPRETVLAMLMAHADLRHAGTVTFSVDELSASTGIDAERVRLALHALSLEPGALAAQTLEHLYLGNPIWLAPGIRMGARFVFPMPQAIMSHVHRIMRRLAREANALDLLDQRRADYLERRLVETLGKALPGADVRANVQWTLGTQRFESDAVAILDKVMIVAEAKAHHLTPEGLRGAPDRVRRHVRDLILEPSIQSARLEQVVDAARSGSEDARGVLAAAGLPPAEGIEQVIRISITLDDLSVISAAEPELREAGWIPDGHELAPMMNIADLMVVADVLDQPIDFIHYLAERGPFQRTFELLGDELDFLGLYLETGFNLGKQEDRMRFSPSGMSAPIDRHYDAVHAGSGLPNPLRGEAPSSGR
ncbi:hypothetical protein [Sphingomonas sp.]|uniref:hypothetical protein n=1 Tax=Sphingomonas sp. TaxID=28214 RepID=UPI002DF1EB81|nr:hypothetical protein [Sphingomonas sp.]